ncbi:MAG: hypothetical protein AMS18_01260 [Gemmatimonas sp. SG8_17]|nr:MAG: hypothetical protein AMS18_01260 [Gemmatimonas sp. SG8_17]
MNSPSFSFVVPVLNAESTINACLQSIGLARRPSDQLIVVDNGSTDGTLDIVKSYPGVELYSAPERTIAELRNLGAQNAAGEVLAFVDSDCVLAEDWRECAETTLRESSVAATGSRYEVPDRAGWIERAWFSQRLSRRQPVTYINSGNLVVRRAAFEDVGGFDERLVTDEDYDLGRRLNAALHAVVEDPAIRATHLGNPKTVGAFYRKLRWHATSSLDTQSLTRPDRPTIMTLLFLVAGTATVVQLGYMLVGQRGVPWLLASLPAVISLTVAERVRRYRNVRHSLQLAALYFVFYCARASVLLRAVGRRLRSRLPFPAER